VAREFALNFNGTKIKVGILEFEVSEFSIFVVTGNLASDKIDSRL